MVLPVARLAGAEAGVRVTLTRGSTVSEQKGKTDMIDGVAKETGLTKAEAGRAVDAVLGYLKTNLKAGESVLLRDIGTLKVVTFAARVGVRPGTKEKMDIPGGKKVKFIQSKLMKESLNR